MYQDLYTEEKKVHTLVALPVIIGILGVLAFFFSGFSPQEKQPLEVKETITPIVTNLTHSNTTICWQTDEKTIGSLKFAREEDSLRDRELDERDLVQLQTSRLNHCVRLANLDSSTVYKYQLEADEEFVTEILSFKTPQKHGLTRAANPVICKVLQSNGLPVDDGIVLVRVKGAQPLSGFIKQSGECLVPLHHLIEKDTLKQLASNVNRKVEIELFDETGSRATISTTTEYVSSLPSAILGRTYVVDSTTFEETSAVLGETIQKAQDSQTDSVEEVVSDSPLELFFPKKNASISGSKPLFKGKSELKSSVSIKLDEEKSGVTIVRVDKDGLWSYVPGFSLEPGLHTVVIESVGTEERHVIERTFTTLKSGLAVLGNATPEATITTEPTPTAAIVTPTTAPTTITVTPTPPVSGFDIVPFSILSVSFIILGAGLLFIF